MLLPGVLLLLLLLYNFTITGRTVTQDYFIFKWFAVNGCGGGRVAFVIQSHGIQCGMI